MNTLKELIEKHKNILAKAQEMVDAANNDKRSLTKEEREKFNGLIGEAAEAKANIEAERARIEAERDQEGFQNFLSQSATGRPLADPSIQGNEPGKDEHKNINRFSFLKFFREATNGTLTGVEKEMAQQAVKDAQNSGREVEGLGIPQIVLSHSGGSRHVNEMSVTTGGGDHGRDLVPTELRSVIDILRERLMVHQMGASLLGGLSGNVDFPRMQDTDDPTEKSEVAASDKLNPEVDLISLRPKRLPVHAEITRQLLVQSSLSVEAWLREFLAFRIASRMDKGALVGTGTGNQPTGLYNIVGIPVVPIGADGGAPEREHIVRLEGAIDAANADYGNLGYLTTPGVRTKLKLTKLDAGSGKFIWETKEELNGYVARVSTNSPSNLTKGAGEDLHGIAFGNWAGMMIGQWGGIEVLLNPYSRDTEGIIRLNLWTFYDVAVERPEMFALIKDADVS